MIKFDSIKSISIHLFVSCIFIYGQIKFKFLFFCFCFFFSIHLLSPRDKISSLNLLMNIYICVFGCGMYQMYVVDGDLGTMIFFFFFVIMLIFLCIDVKLGEPPNVDRPPKSGCEQFLLTQQLMMGTRVCHPKGSSRVIGGH